MPCILVLLLLGTPRLALLLVFLFSNYLTRAFHSDLLLLAGFLFMPLTTLAYAWSMNTWGRVEGIGLAACIVAALLDLGLIGASGRSRRRQDVIDA